MTIREKLEVSAAVAEACGSTGWVVALTNVCNWMAAELPEQGQQDIFGATPDARSGAGLHPHERAHDQGAMVRGRDEGHGPRHHDRRDRLHPRPSRAFRPRAIDNEYATEHTAEVL
jgi:hypothetical protein